MLTTRRVTSSSIGRLLLAGIGGLVGLYVLTRPAGASAASGGQSASGGELNLFQAIVLGIVEGVTEYLPVSSTGHLLVTQQLLGITDSEAAKAAADSYAIAIQIGAILAVLGIYRDRFGLMLSGVIGKSTEGLLLIRSLVISTVPAVLLGLLFDDWIKERLLRTWPIAAAWIVGGVIILVFVRNQHRLSERITSVAAISPLTALIIGCAQSLAMWPGTSRSFVTLLVAMLLGASLATAVEYAFLMGFVVLSGASLYELAKNGGDIIDQFGIASPLVGIVVAGLAAWVSVKWMISYLQRRPLTIFGWYRIGIGTLTVVLLLAGVLEN